MRRVIAFLLVAALAFIFVSPMQPANAAMFEDVPTDHWTYAAVKELRNAGLVQGYDTDGPTGLATHVRYEFAMVTALIIEKLEDEEIRARAKPVHKLLVVALATEYETELRFMVESKDSKDEVEPMLELSSACVRLVEEALDELRLRASIPVTEEERSVTRKNGRNIFRDVPYEHWSYKAIDELQACGLVEGYPDGDFMHRRSFTRYEMAMVVALMVDRLSKIETAESVELKAKLLLLAMAAEYECGLREMGVNYWEIDSGPSWITQIGHDVRPHFAKEIASSSDS